MQRKKILIRILKIELKEVKAVCKEMELHCKPEGGNIKAWYIYTQNQSRWIACYYTLFGQAVIYNSGEPLFTDKNEFKEGLQRKLKEIKEESIKDRIKSLEKDFV